MKNLIISLALAAFFVLPAFAMEQEGQIFDRSHWSERDQKADVSKQEPKILRIITGHTVTKESNAIETLRAIQKYHMDDKKWADIAYNFCLDEDGNGYRCRTIDQAPAILPGHNIGSCGVGLIGRFDENEVTETMARKWGKRFGEIAFECGFEKLVRQENIFGMSERSSNYPVSPGVHFMEKFDFIVEIANERLTELAQAASK